MRLLQSMRVDPQNVIVGERMREMSEEGVEMMMDGAQPDLLPPIIIRQQGKDYVLVAGRHRLEVARRLGWPVQRADLWEFEFPEEYEIMEIDENLKRVNLSFVEETKHAEERVDKTASLTARKAAKAAQEAADRAEAEARAKGVKNPKRNDKAAKAADMSARNAEKRVQRNGAAGSNLLDRGKTKTNTIAEVAKATGLAPKTIQRAYNDAKAIEAVVPGALKVMKGTLLDSRDQVREMARLAKSQPEVVRAAVARAKNGEATKVKELPGSNAQKAVNAKRKADKKAAEMETEVGRVKAVLELYQSAYAALSKGATLAQQFGMTRTEADGAAAIERLELAIERLKGARDNAV